MKLELTIQVDVPDDSDLDIVPKMLKAKIVNYNHKEDFVSATFITTPDKSILERLERLEHLEQVTASISELLSDKLSTEALELLNNHNSFWRAKNATK